ncbi:MAG: hypothetical protein ACI9GZ_003479, partial [Bacteroidia bacterium]
RRQSVFSNPSGYLTFPALDLDSSITCTFADPFRDPLIAAAFPVLRWDPSGLPVGCLNLVISLSFPHLLSYLSGFS